MIRKYYIMLYIYYVIMLYIYLKLRLENRVSFHINKILILKYKRNKYVRNEN